LIFPTGLARIREVYGDPTPYRTPDGGVQPHWEQILDYVQLPATLVLGWDRTVPVSRVRVHYKICGSLSRVFHTIKQIGYWPALESFDGTYVWRPKRTGEKLSTHSWGIAIDLNAASNRLGSSGDMPKDVVKAFRDEGWEWGGDWAFPDPMHFQAAYGY
jgi:hypothetical protein